ncbi:CbiX/SirB N-terminal domain-containing protein [Paenibacillus rhizoplanae]
MLWEKTGYRSVESCFIAIAKPSLPDGLERCLALGARKNYCSAVPAVHRSANAAVR